jgi:hypothetical protein
VPSYGWSGPAQVPLGATSLTTSSFTASTLSDISPYVVPIPPGNLNLGTRVRLVAHGSYTGTSTTVTLQFGFYMANVGTVVGSAVVLGLGPAITVISGTGVPWMADYFGKIAAVSVTANATTATIVGRGHFYSAAAIGGAWTVSQIPQTLAAATVVQTANGMNTNAEQNILLGVTPGASVTNLTNIISDELTCELVG